ncbi:MAG: hypothetical protein ACI4VK_02375 [Candidatus Coproplasma sp.]
MDKYEPIEKYSGEDTDSEDFEIQDGVLKKYKGSRVSITIPRSVKKSGRRPL